MAALPVAVLLLLAGCDARQLPDMGASAAAGGAVIAPTAATANVSSSSRSLALGHAAGSVQGTAQQLPGAFAAEAEGGATTSFDWILLVGACVFLMLADVLILSKYCSGTVGRNLCGFGFMLAASAVYNAILWQHRGKLDGASWTAGYVLEWSLSMDNLFIFFLIFRSFKVPQAERYKALMLGIWGAVAFRVAFIFGLSALIHTSTWIRFIVGIVLIWSGYQALADDDDDDIEEMKAVQFFRFVLGGRLSSSYSNGQLFLNEEGKLKATLLFLVVCVVMVIDVLFAFDSVGAKTGQISSTYINLSSAVMAMLSLRALFFLLQDLVDYFELLKYAICSILVLVGVDMIIESMNWVQVPISITCAVIAVIFFVGIAGSVVKHSYWDDEEEEEEHKGAGNEDTPRDEDTRKKDFEKNDEKHELNHSDTTACSYGSANASPRYLVDEKVSQ